jgi:hypothetical protein
MITVFCILAVAISISSMHAVAFIRNIHMHLYPITNLLMLYFWIKLILKMPIFLTGATTHQLPPFSPSRPQPWPRSLACEEGGDSHEGCGARVDVFGTLVPPKGKALGGATVTVWQGMCAAVR